MPCLPPCPPPWWPRALFRTAAHLPDQSLPLLLSLPVRAEGGAVVVSAPSPFRRDYLRRLLPQLRRNASGEAGRPAEIRRSASARQGAREARLPKVAITLLSQSPLGRRGLTGRAFKNTFAPGAGGDVIGVDMVIAGLRHGTIKEASLPGDVHGAVDAELGRLEREAVSPARALVLLLGAMGEVKGGTRLQKYAFLVDMGLYSKKTRGYLTMYGWEASRRGAYSSNLEHHVQKAIEGGLVEALAAHAPEGKDLGYRLSPGGEKKFQELLCVFGDDVVAIKGLLSRFQNDRTVEPLVAHACREYPEYATEHNT